MRISAGMVEQLQKGEEKARCDFWKEAFESVLAICSRILGPGPSAVDVTTDLLNDFMFRYVDNLSNLHGAWPYIKLMAIRRSVRERQRLMTGEQFDEMRMLQPEKLENSPETTILMPQLNKCMETLTPKAQSVIRLKYRQELSNAQIGGLVGGTKQYIGRLLKKSLTLLRGCLQQKGVANGNG